MKIFHTILIPIFSLAAFELIFLEYEKNGSAVFGLVEKICFWHEKKS